MKEIKSIRSAIVHGGCFHADDVFATAIIKMINPNIQITRGFSVPENYDGIAYDIGFGEFDHHQKDKRYRDNGVPYAAFGLIWEAYGEHIIDKEYVDMFDKDFVQAIDKSDNTGEPNHIAQVISMMNPNWDEDTDCDDAFYEAVDFASAIITRFMDGYKSSAKAKAMVEACVTDSPIVVLPQFMPWKDVICHKDIYYVIFPSNRGGYNIQAVPKASDTIELKRAFPESWRGVAATELQIMTGIRTITFCHPSGFMCAADTLADAMMVARQAYENT